jgi:hypothetical protein
MLEIYGIYTKQHHIVYEELLDEFNGSKKKLNKLASLFMQPGSLRDPNPDSVAAKIIETQRFRSTPYPTPNPIALTGAAPPPRQQATFVTKTIQGPRPQTATTALPTPAARRAPRTNAITTIVPTPTPKIIQTGAGTNNIKTNKHTSMEYNETLNKAFDGAL